MWSQNRKKQLEESYGAGAWTGLRTTWYENGQKAQELTHQDDKLTGAVSWKPRGETCPATNIEGGDGIVVYYYEAGAEKSRTIYKDGEEDTSIAADAEKASLVEEWAEWEAHPG